MTFFGFLFRKNESRIDRETIHGKIQNVKNEKYTQDEK